MSNEVTTTQSAIVESNMAIGAGGLVINDAKGMWAMAEMIHKSSWKPKGLNTPEDIFLGIQFGYGIGLRDPLQIVQNVAVVNGRPSFYGPMLMGICKASEHFQDHYEEIEEITNAEGERDIVCHCYVHRKGEAKPQHGRFSWRDAIRASLTSKDTYKGYPRDMLMWKARSRAFHAAFPDVLKGVAFEQDADSPAPRVPVDGEVVGETPKPKGLAGLVASAAAKAPESAPTAAQEPAGDVFSERGSQDTPEAAEAPEKPTRARRLKPHEPVEPEPERDPADLPPDPELEELFGAGE